MADGVEANFGRETYFVDKADDFWWTLSRTTSAGDREKIIQFYTMPQDNVNFITMNFYCSQSPDSVFTQKLFLNIRTEDGVNSVLGDLFTQTRNGVTRKHTIESRAELQDIMQNCFRLPVQSSRHREGAPSGRIQSILSGRGAFCHPHSGRAPSFSAFPAGRLKFPQLLPGLRAQIPGHLDLHSYILIAANRGIFHGNNALAS